MRVGFVTHYAELYGANRSLIGLLNGLMSMGVACHVVLPVEGPMVLELAKRNIPHLIIPFRWWLSKESPRSSGTYILWLLGVLSNITANIGSLPYITKQMREWNIDFIHTNSAVTPIGAMASFVLGCPHVWHLREFCDLDYKLRYDFGRKTTLSIIRKADALIAISNAIASYYFDGLPNNKKHVIYNGIATIDELIKLRDASHSIEEKLDVFKFALVGMIHPSKGHDIAIRAFSLLNKKHPNIRLFIVGEGDTLPLKKLSAKLGVAPKIEFWGYIEDPYKAYFAANAVLMCSGAEAMGRVTLEAMAACKPVIGRASAGTLELIEDEHTGLLFNGGERSLADSMERLLLNPHWARQLGENGWERVHSKFTIEQYAQNVYQVYREVLGTC